MAKIDENRCKGSWEFLTQLKIDLEDLREKLEEDFNKDNEKDFKFATKQIIQITKKSVEEIPNEWRIPDVSRQKHNLKNLENFLYNFPKDRNKFFGYLKGKSKELFSSSKENEEELSKGLISCNLAKIMMKTSK